MFIDQPIEKQIKLSFNIDAKIIRMAMCEYQLFILDRAGGRVGVLCVTVGGSGVLCANCSLMVSLYVQTSQWTSL